MYWVRRALRLKMKVEIGTKAGNAFIIYCDDFEATIGGENPSYSFKKMRAGTLFAINPRDIEYIWRIR